MRARRAIQASRCQPRQDAEYVRSGVCVGLRYVRHLQDGMVTRVRDQSSGRICEGFVDAVPSFVAPEGMEHLHPRMVARTLTAGLCGS